MISDRGLVGPITDFCGGERVAGKQCGLLPNYTVDIQGRCVKYNECSMTGRTSSPKCLAKSQK